MKEVKHYICEICGTEYHEKKKCMDCEKNHIKPVAINGARYNNKSGYPVAVNIEMSNGEIIDDLQMSILEEIIKEIENKRESLIDMSDDESELCDVEDWYNEGVDDGKIKAYLDAIDIIRSHMNKVTKCNECDGGIKKCKYILPVQ